MKNTVMILALALGTQTISATSYAATFDCEFVLKDRGLIKGFVIQKTFEEETIPSDTDMEGNKYPSYLSGYISISSPDETVKFSTITQDGLVRTMSIFHLPSQNYFHMDPQSPTPRPIGLEIENKSDPSRKTMQYYGKCAKRK